MLQSRKLSLTLALTALLLILAVPATADDDSDSDSDGQSVVGTWESVRLEDGEIQRALFTFHGDGTFVNRSSISALSSSLGVWEQAGDNTAVSKSRGYQYASSGLPLFVITTVLIVDLSADGQSFSCDAMAEITLADGTPVNTIDFSFSADRITID